MEPEVDSRLVSHFNGKWQASNGPFEHFDGTGETGWSLLAQAVNHWHMRRRSWCARSACCRTGVWMIS